MATEEKLARQTELQTLYLRNMQKIKWRMKAIKDIYTKQRTTTYSITNIEFCVLQIRKILELIAFSTLVSDVDVYMQELSNVERMWNAKLILKDIERIHPDFYPKPIRIDENDRTIWHDYSEPYLTRALFEEIYEKCGKYLHERFPFVTEGQLQKEYDEIWGKIGDWAYLIICLLNTHIVRLYNEKTLFYISMGTEDEKPKGNIFSLEEE